MPNRSPLYASQEKIKRAEGKFIHLKSMVNIFLRDNFYTRIEVDGEIINMVAGIKGPISTDIAFEVVEAVGHLRSALDKMVCAMVIANNRGTSGVSFPFGGSDSEGQPEQFPTGRHDTVKGKLTARQWSFILAQKSYPGGNDTLWSINQIANADKHGADLVSVNPLGIAKNTEIGLLPGQTFGEIKRLKFNSIEFTDEKKEGVVVSFHKDNQAYVKGEIAGEVIFRKISPISGANILVTLNKQIRMTKGIVKISRSII